MQVTFVRTRGQRDRIHVHRDDGGEVGWEFPTYGHMLPHDLVHLVVEAGLGLDGIWARVAAGADLGRMMQQANRRGGRDKFAPLGEPAGLLLAEALANQRWLDGDFDGDAVLATGAAAAAGIGRKLPAAATVAAVAAVRLRLQQLHAQWRAIGSKGAVTLTYP